MAGINTYDANLLLNFELGGATAASPATRALGLATGVPVIGTWFEIAPGSGYARTAMTFASASGGTATNSNSATFGPFSGACTISGMHLWDTAAATAGNNLRFGTLATARTIGVGDSIIFNANSLVVTLS